MVACPIIGRVHHRPARRRGGCAEVEVGGVEPVRPDPFDQQRVGRSPGDQRIPANLGQREVAEIVDPRAGVEPDGVGILEIVTEYETYRLGQEIDGAQYLEADPQWFRLIVAGVVDGQKKLDPIIHDALTDDWPLSRLDTTLRAILRAGAFELTAKQDVPVAVIVSEYVDIAKAFFDGEEPKLVNAVLDRVARKERGPKV